MAFEDAAEKKMLLRPEGGRRSLEVRESSFQNTAQPPPIVQLPPKLATDSRTVASAGASDQLAKRGGEGKTSGESLLAKPETAKPNAFLNEFRVSHPLVKALVVWTCRILGLLGIVGGIGALCDPSTRNSGSPDEPGVGAWVVVFLMFGGMTAYGFWPRKKLVPKSAGLIDKQKPSVIPKASRGFGPPPIPPAVSGNSPGLTVDDLGESKGLFLVRGVQDPALITRCQALLDAWSGGIPFSPIKKLGTKTEFVSATEIATYKTTVTSQLEKRWLEDHEVPYRGQSLPAESRPRSEFDPWQMEFPRCADFGKHHHSIDLPDTRRIYDCSRCHATGRVTCSSCAGRGEVRCDSCSGRGEVQCNYCSGYGTNKCRDCEGRGHIRQTRRVSRLVSCPHCDGQGWTYAGSGKSYCVSCGGSATKMEDQEEEYYVPCGHCAASGKTPCSNCQASGKVPCSKCGASGKLTCLTCRGSGQITCPDCQGARQLMAYVSAEQTEEPAEHEHQYIPQGLPSFRKKDNPLTKLDGAAVFSQDEASAINVFGFAGDPAASVLSAEAEVCRQSHQGHVVRQRVVVRRCSLVEYRYRHSGKAHAIFLNPDHGLVEDLAGPVQDAIQNMDALAQKAFDEERFEDAYRLNLRALCMDEATDAEKQLRKRILKRLTAAYRNTALLAWLICAL